VRRSHVSALDLADTSVSGEDDDGGKVALKSSVHVGEALDIEHVDFIDEEDTGHELSDTVVDVAVHDLVDLKSQLLGDFSLLRSVDLGHETHEIVATLGSGVGNIKIVKGHILNDFLSLVDVTLGDGNVLLSLKIVLSGVRVGSADALDGATGGLNVDDIADSNLLLLDVLVNTGIKFELLLSLGSLERDNN